MLTKNKIKFIRSLSSKKERYSHRQFIIEGIKGIDEALGSNFKIEAIYGLEKYIDNYDSDLFTIVSKKEMERISSLSSSPGLVAIANFKDWHAFTSDKGKYILVDKLNDPGNLGSIIRSADWFGFDGVICSKDSVDVYNPKVVQSSMGSIFRLPVYYEDLEKVLHASSIKSYAAIMDGSDMNELSFSKNGLLVLGSESHGLSENLINLCSDTLTIPRFGKAESLNVGVAAGIICQHWNSQL